MSTAQGLVEGQMMAWVSICCAFYSSFWCITRICVTERDVGGKALSVDFMLNGSSPVKVLFVLKRDIQGWDSWGVREPTQRSTVCVGWTRKTLSTSPTSSRFGRVKGALPLLVLCSHRHNFVSKSIDRVSNMGSSWYRMCGSLLNLDIQGWQVRERSAIATAALEHALWKGRTWPSWTCGKTITACAYLYC